MTLTLAAIIIMGGWVVAIVAAGLLLSLRPGGVPVRLAPAGSPGGLTGRRDEILLGGDAEVFGNVRGRVQAVRLRPESRELQDVELAGDFGLGTQPVPATAILSADGQVLRLAQAWPEPPIDAPDTGRLTLRHNMTVVSAEGKGLGKLRLVCFEPASRRVTALVVAGRRTPARRLLPIDRVKEAGPDRIITDLKVSDWTSLPPFATDWEIRQAVLERLTADSELQALQRSLRIEVVDQEVRLEGYVANRAQADRVTQLVRAVPEVLNLDVDLVTDDGLARAVTDAIGRDPVTSAAIVQVSTHHGTVDITGEAPDRATARAIERVAGQVPGVQGVHNMVGLRSPAGLAS